MSNNQKLTEAMMQDAFREYVYKNIVKDKDKWVVSEERFVGDFSKPDFLLVNKETDEVTVYELKLWVWRKCLKQCNEADWFCNKKYMVYLKPKRQKTRDEITQACLDNDVGLYWWEPEKGFELIHKSTYVTYNDKPPYLNKFDWRYRLEKGLL